VAKAEFNGTTQYHNREHDVWVLQMVFFFSPFSSPSDAYFLLQNDNGDIFEQRLFVESTNVNTPVYYTTHNITNKGKSPYFFFVLSLQSILNLIENA
jgi:hypothetical protein